MSTKKKRKAKKSGNLHLPSQRRLPQLDLDAELNRHNGSIGELLILAGLLQGSPDQRRRIMDSMESRWFITDGFPQFLFQVATNSLKTNLNEKLSKKWIISQVPKYFTEIWNYRPNKLELRGELFTCAQILDFAPTPEQVDRAIALSKEWAEVEGLL